MILQLDQNELQNIVGSVAVAYSQREHILLLVAKQRDAAHHRAAHDAGLVVQNGIDAAVLVHEEFVVGVHQRSLAQVLALLARILRTELLPEDAGQNSFLDDVPTMSLRFGSYMSSSV